MPVIFITKNDEVSKKKTEDYLELVERMNDKKMILVEKENAIVPNKPEDVKIMKTFLYKGYANPPGMQNFVHEDEEYHWYVPSRVKY